MSSSASLATSAARKPRRTSMVRIAKSRQPFGVLLSQDAKRRRTWSRSNPFGQPGQSPTGDGWHCKGERLLDYAFDMKKAEQ